MSDENNGKILSRRDFLRWASVAGGAALLAGCAPAAARPRPRRPQRRLLSRRPRLPFLPRPLSRRRPHRNTQA